MKNFLKPIIVLILLFPVIYNPASAQNVGLSFSFFFPKNGEFSTPISPFSFRGVGVSLNEYVGIETGFTLYRMTGLGVTDLPFDTDRSIVGPNFTLLVPVELVLTAPLPGVEFSVKGGGFAFLPFDNKIRHGNLDKAIAEAYNYQLVDSDYEGNGSVGFGFHFGAEVIFYVTQTVGLSFEGNYLLGGADFEMEGSYSYADNGTIQTVSGADAAFEDAQIDLTGLELSIGVIMQAGGGGKQAPRRRRR